MSLQESEANEEKAEAGAAGLFSPLVIRDVFFRNRIVVAPVCTYSSEGGFANDWHLVNLGSRAAGGAALVFTEAIAVAEKGRISPFDLGIYLEEHVEMLSQIARFIKSQGAVAGIQLNHAGRKASTKRPWEGGTPITDKGQGGWIPVAPSPLSFDDNYSTPTELTKSGIAEVVGAFAQAARRAKKAGFEALNLQAGHGYLLHQFLSPVSNQRVDEYGGSFENRSRLVLEVADAIRQEWPKELPFFVRVSATDWLPDLPDSWQLAETIRLATLLKERGVDVIDVSSGGLAVNQQIKLGPNYQVPFSEAIRTEAGIMTEAVGLITQPEQADEIIRSGKADMVGIARELMRDPYWPLHAAKALGQETRWPPQYLRAKV